MPVNSPSPIRLGAPRRRRVAGAAIVLAMALGTGGCSSSGSSQPQAAPSSSMSQPVGAEPVRTKIALGRVAGAFHQPNRRIFRHHRVALLHRVGRAVDSWLDGGFVGVNYPRSNFPTAFASFTHAAKRDARHQRRLMTNWRLRHRIDGVVVKKRSVVVDVLAPNGRPAGATARVRLVFATTGKSHRRVALTGRLFLTPTGGRAWKVFGYDVSQGGTR